MPYPYCQVHAYCSQAPVRDVGYGLGSCAPCGFSSVGPEDYVQKSDVRTRGRGSLPVCARVSVLAWDSLTYYKRIADGAQFEFVETSDRD